nr:MAG TPA: hypothetical protein [Bacteriophage sp.]
MSDTITTIFQTVPGKASGWERGLNEKEKKPLLSP